MPKIAIHDFHDAEGYKVGVGTQVELAHWSADNGPMAGYTLGAIIGYEPASEDEKRRAAWAREAVRVAA